MIFDLLTLQEARKLPKRYLKRQHSWWLKNKGSYQNVITVTATGDINYYGSSCNLACIAVRPVVRLSEKELSELKQNDEGIVELLEQEWIDLSYDLGQPVLLAKECEEDMVFDKTSNVFEGSEIQHYLLKYVK